MIIERFKYHEKFCVKSTFLDTSIDVEGVLEPGETLQEGVAKARAEMLKSLPKPIERTPEEKISLFTYKGVDRGPYPTNHPIQPSEINLLHDRMKDAIDDCQTLEELKAWKEANPVFPHKILVHYNERLKTLSNGVADK